MASIPTSQAGETKAQDAEDVAAAGAFRTVSLGDESGFDLESKASNASATAHITSMEEAQASFKKLMDAMAGLAYANSGAKKITQKDGQFSSVLKGNYQDADGAQKAYKVQIEIGPARTHVTLAAGEAASKEKYLAMLQVAQKVAAQTPNGRLKVDGLLKVLGQKAASDDQPEDKAKLEAKKAAIKSALKEFFTKDGNGLLLQSEADIDAMKKSNVLTDGDAQSIISARSVAASDTSSRLASPIASDAESDAESLRVRSLSHPSDLSRSSMPPLMPDSPVVDSARPRASSASTSSTPLMSLGSSVLSGSVREGTTEYKEAFAEL